MYCLHNLGQFSIPEGACLFIALPLFILPMPPQWYRPQNSPHPIQGMEWGLFSQIEYIQIFEHIIQIFLAWPAGIFRLALFKLEF